MAKKKKVDGDNSFPAKYAKVLGEEWMSECDSSDTEDLKRKVIEAETLIEEQENLRDADETLKNLKDQLKALNGGYKDSIFYQRAKIKYAMRTLETRGTTPST